MANVLHEGGRPFESFSSLDYRFQVAIVDYAKSSSAAMKFGGSFAET